MCWCSCFVCPLHRSALKCVTGQSPAAASAPGRFLHTDRSAPSSDCRVSAADAASRPSAASPPAGKTTDTQRGGGGVSEEQTFCLNTETHNYPEAVTCLIFSLSSEVLPVQLMRRLFLNMAMRVLASPRWILGIRFFSCCCRPFRISIIRWL